MRYVLRKHSSLGIWHVISRQLCVAALCRTLSMLAYWETMDDICFVTKRGGRALNKKHRVWIYEELFESDMRLIVRTIEFSIKLISHLQTMAGRQDILGYGLHIKNYLPSNMLLLNLAFYYIFGVVQPDNHNGL